MLRMGRGLGSARFRDQVVGLGCLWEAWTEAEQVVVVYSLIRRLPSVPARFLLNLLTHAAASDPAHDLAHAEATANDPAWVSQLAESKDSGAADLLYHLPLLRPSNTEAKMQYLSLIPKVLAQAVASAGSQQSTALENARQLLSYTLIHPAVTMEERRALTHWLRTLEERLADHHRRPPPPPPAHTHPHPLTHSHPHEGFPSTATTTATTTTTTTSSSNNNNSGSSHSFSHSGTSLGPLKSRWTSDTPVVLPPDTGQTKTLWSPALAPWDDVGWCGSVGITGLVGGAPSEAPQSPNNSATSSRSSGCESNPEEACQPHPGMRDVGVWLKSLRLHKYSPLLCNLTYEELLALDETTLEAQGVTKGARHKIVLSINKLKERHTQLVQIEKEVMSGGHLLSCLNELKAIILTPFPPYNPPGDASSHHHLSQQQQQQAHNSTTLDCTTTPSSLATTTSITTTTTVPSLPVSSSSSASVPSSFPSSSATATPSATSSLSTSNSSSMCSLRGEERDLLKEEAPRPSSLEPESGNSIAENDLPSQFTRVMGKVCTQLLVSVRLEDECVSAFLGLVEKCVSHEAFTPTQIRRLQSWKQQIIRVWHPLPPKTKDTRHNRRWSQQYSGDGFLGGSFRVPRVGGQRHAHLPTGLLVGSKAFPPHQPHQLFPLPPAAAAAAAAASLGGLMSPRNSLPGLPSLGVGGLLSPQQFLAKRPSLQETPSERTRSAPSRPHQLPLSGPTRSGPIPPPPPTTAPSTSLALGTGGCGDLRLPGGSGTILEPHFSPRASFSHLGPPPSSPDPADNDITDRLESLCLSVTEHALG
ncbi:protein Smaug homolog 2-like isoform X3 [Portunus trituberculatus]|uniref:protein Smaug homolog 2-like isoform X3 n=1 Tax=Portunus trituberculatus TaxID=210409 RepID=UPI001E1CD246|nr:protein Smaug homolog 2-like isoform X3 [Portunus trituberculatus]